MRQAEMPPQTPSTIPKPVSSTFLAPLPTAGRAETFTISVNNVAINELLFALARDAQLNLDIHPGISGAVTLHAHQQTVQQLLEKISRQADIRYELIGNNLSVSPDSPYLKHYKLDYVNVARNVTAAVSSNTQIGGGTTTSTINSGSTPSTGAGNVSNTRIDNHSRNQFWESLERNIRDLLRETDKLLPEGSSETIVEQNSTQIASGAAALPHGSGHRAAQGIAQALQSNPNPNAASQANGNSLVRRNTFREAASVIVNQESGVISVRATQKQQERIQEFLDSVADAIKRQVLIEATIIEVTLNDNYQQGIAWSRLTGNGTFSYLGNALTGTANLAYRQGGNPESLITLLETFGTTKVLSSPRLSVLNNQTALLKVVENYIYFSVKADTTNTANVGSNTVYTTTPQSVSVGLIVSVTPQISANDMIVLNIRPTITSVAREVNDPNPELAKYAIKNNVPVIRTREIESVMRVASGATAVLGGLMQDQLDAQTQRLPGLGEIPVAGELFNNRANASRKTELVILLRPLVIRDASLSGDYADLRHFAPNDDFFHLPGKARPVGSSAAKY